MAIPRILAAVIATSILIGLSGCATPKKQLMKMETSQVKLRSMQTRAFDTTDEKKTLRSVISTLQDFDFLIDEANKVLGLVSATRRTDWLQITVTVRPKGETQVFVRANMEYKQKGVEDPSVYQKFFTYLEKSMFLTAYEVD
ncbi:MAG: hypothetical protein OXI24_01425 [Candidatus Poribacteria bacterium]|nr:hypothetical protein [Candidatus Poribacteria bacterium]MXZ08359.1 hypothetical protein [Gemmatimonadota bacterium]MYF78934.1 hypothetical protein [Chloroflexota bacterium]